MKLEERLVDSEEGDEVAFYAFRGLSRDAVARTVNKYFIRKKYRLEKGTLEDGVYGIGSDVLRFLFGAFARRYKFKVTVEEKHDEVVLRFQKGMSGMMGGAIGYSRMKKEFKKIESEITLEDVVE